MVKPSEDLADGRFNGLDAGQHGQPIGGKTHLGARFGGWSQWLGGGPF